MKKGFLVLSVALLTTILTGCTSTPSSSSSSEEAKSSVSSSAEASSSSSSQTTTSSSSSSAASSSSSSINTNKVIDATALKEVLSKASNADSKVKSGTLEVSEKQNMGKNTTNYTYEFGNKYTHVKSVNNYETSDSYYGYDTNNKPFGIQVVDGDNTSITITSNDVFNGPTIKDYPGNTIYGMKGWISKLSDMIEANSNNDFDAYYDTASTPTKYNLSIGTLVPGGYTTVLDVYSVVFEVSDDAIVSMEITYNRYQGKALTYNEKLHSYNYDRKQVFKTITYKFTQEIGNRDAVNPYAYENYLFTSFDLAKASTKEAIADGSTIKLTANEQYLISITNALPETASVSVDTPVVSFGDVPTSSIYGEYIKGSISIEGYKEGTYTCTIKTANVTKTLTFVVGASTDEIVEEFTSHSYETTAGQKLLFKEDIAYLVGSEGTTLCSGTYEYDSTTKTLTITDQYYGEVYTESFTYNADDGSFNHVSDEGSSWGKFSIKDSYISLEQMVSSTFSATLDGTKYEISFDASTTTGTIKVDGQVNTSAKYVYDGTKHTVTIGEFEFDITYYSLKNDMGNFIASMPLTIDSVSKSTFVNDKYGYLTFSASTDSTSTGTAVISGVDYTYSYNKDTGVLTLDVEGQGVVTQDFTIVGDTLVSSTNNVTWTLIEDVDFLTPSQLVNNTYQSYSGTEEPGEVTFNFVASSSSNPQSGTITLGGETYLYAYFVYSRQVIVYTEAQTIGNPTAILNVYGSSIYCDAIGGLYVVSTPSGDSGDSGEVSPLAGTLTLEKIFANEGKLDDGYDNIVFASTAEDKKTGTITKNDSFTVNYSFNEETGVFTVTNATTGNTICTLTINGYQLVSDDYSGTFEGPFKLTGVNQGGSGETSSFTLEDIIKYNYASAEGSTLTFKDGTATISSYGYTACYGDYTYDESTHILSITNPSYPDEPETLTVDPTTKTISSVNYGTFSISGPADTSTGEDLTLDEAVTKTFENVDYTLTFTPGETNDTGTAYLGGEAYSYTYDSSTKTFNVSGFLFKIEGQTLVNNEVGTFTIKADGGSASTTLTGEDLVANTFVSSDGNTTITFTPGETSVNQGNATYTSTYGDESATMSFTYVYASYNNTITLTSVDDTTTSYTFTIEGMTFTNSNVGTFSIQTA